MSEGREAGDERPDRKPPPFAHASEAELGRILDFYEVRWEYEPHLYPILWSQDGDVLESFAPDFYLPDLDLYIELTTLRQRLVRKKNRKLRRLRELYPDIRIKLFYARDFRALMLKYGKLAIVDELSGTVGQVVPTRPAPEAVASPGPPPAIASRGVDPAATPRGGESSRSTHSVPPSVAAPARPRAIAGTGALRPAAQVPSPRSRRKREAPAR